MLNEPQPVPPALRDALAHLAYATMLVSRAWIEVGDERMYGRFGYPDEESKTLPVWFDRDPGAPPYVHASGADIQIRYTCEGVDYTWTSVVRTQVDATRITVDLPTVIARQERRAAPRVTPAAEDGVVLELRRPGQPELKVAVGDLSSGGLSFWSQGAHFAPDARLLARLHLGSAEPLRLVLGVVSVRPAGDGEDVVGCAYASIAATARQELAAFVYERLRTDR